MLSKKGNTYFQNFKSIYFIKKVTRNYLYNKIFTYRCAESECTIAKQILFLWSEASKSSSGQSVKIIYKCQENRLAYTFLDVSSDIYKLFRCSTALYYRFLL